MTLENCFEGKARPGPWQSAPLERSQPRDRPAKSAWKHHIQKGGLGNPMVSISASPQGHKRARNKLDFGTTLWLNAFCDVLRVALLVCVCAVVLVHNNFGMCPETPQPNSLHPENEDGEPSWERLKASPQSPLPPLLPRSTIRPPRSEPWPAQHLPPPRLGEVRGEGTQLKPSHQHGIA